MTDADKVASIEKANAYRDMMNSWAWKDFHANCLQMIRQNALEGAINSSTIDNVQLQRGRVKCIDQIESELGFILAGAQ